MLKQISSLVFLIGSTDALQQQTPRPFRVGRPKNQDKCYKRVQPSLLFIGQAYSGSTSLSDQMQLHPQMDFGSTKEHQWFLPDYRKIQTDKQFDNYLEQFWVGCNTTVTFDATMNYLHLALGTKDVKGVDTLRYVKKRLGNNVKLMVMLRDPVETIFHKACTKGSFDTSKFNVESPPNISENDQRPSLNLGVWKKIFPNEKNWLFLSSDEYFENPQKVLNRVFKFAGVDQMQLDTQDLGEQTGRRRCNAKASSDQRKAYWKAKSNMDDKKELETITGMKFKWHNKV